MKYELTLTIRTDEGNKFESLDKIQADDLLHLMSQFTFVLLNIQRKEHDKEIQEIRMENDDIPF